VQTITIFTPERMLHNLICFFIHLNKQEGGANHRDSYKKVALVIKDYESMGVNAA